MSETLVPSPIIVNIRGIDLRFDSRRFRRGGKCADKRVLIANVGHRDAWVCCDIERVCIDWMIPRRKLLSWLLIAVKSKNKSKGTSSDVGDLI